MSKRLSELKTLFFSFVIEFLLFFLIHYCCETSDVSVQLFSAHLLLLGVRRWWSPCQGIAQGHGTHCGFLLHQAISAKVALFPTSEAQSFPHGFFSLFGGLSVDVHSVGIFSLEGPSPSRSLFLLLFIVHQFLVTSSS